LFFPCRPSRSRRDPDRYFQVDRARRFQPGQEEGAGACPELLKQGSVTVISFNDEPVFEGTSLSDLSSVNEKIEAISQGGKYTLLYDAVFKALRSFEDSKERGAIIVFFGRQG